MGKRVLVTGSSGFVGSVMVRKLLERGEEVLGIDIKPPTSGLNYDFVIADVRDYFRDAREVFKEVYHFAAVVGGRANLEGNPLSVASDLAIDSDLFQWAIRTGQPKLVLFSSSAAYPISRQTKSFAEQYLDVNLREDHIDLRAIKNADTMYGHVKMTLEMLAQLGEEKGVRCHIFRPFSGYGETQDLTYPFPNLIRLAKEDKGMEIWSDSIRDFIQIEDVCDAVLKAVELDIQGPTNLGTGVATKFSELARTMDYLANGERAFEREVKVLSDKPAGVYRRVANPYKMLSFYHPRYSVEDGIQLSLEAAYATQ